MTSRVSRSVVVWGGLNLKIDLRVRLGVRIFIYTDDLSQTHNLSSLVRDQEPVQRIGGSRSQRNRFIIRQVTPLRADGKVENHGTLRF